MTQCSVAAELQPKHSLCCEVELVGNDGGWTKGENDRITKEEKGREKGGG